MKKLVLLACIAIVNAVFAFLLIHKQNKIVSLLYEIQKLKEQREQLLETKKNLFIDAQKEQQLSSIQRFAQHELNMKAITIKEAKSIS